MDFDVVIAGGGPAGLAAALTLGRGRKRVLLCDAGTPRNAAATHIQTFVTRDGTPPAEFRRIGREQLAPYPSVSVQGARVQGIQGQPGTFDVHLDTGIVRARRILLCTGMIDEVPDLPGLRDVWGTAAFQCPYCHGWEVRDRRFGYLAADQKACEFALLLRGWTRDVVLFTNDSFDVPPADGERLAAGGINLETRRIDRLVASGGRLERIELADGGTVPLDVLFLHPPQRQVDVVLALGLALDSHGLIVVDDMMQTSAAGIHAAGDIVTQAQGALLAAASGMRAAAALNHALTAEMAVGGALP